MSLRLLLSSLLVILHPQLSWSVTPAPSADPKNEGKANLLPGVSTGDFPVSEEQIPDLPELNLGTGDVIKLTLSDSVQLAIQGATSVLKAQITKEVSGANLLESYGQFLPNLTATANSTYNQGNQYFTSATPTYVSGQTAGTAYAIATDLNIFNGLTDYSRLRSSLLKKDAAQLSIFRAKQAIALDVTQSFLSVVLDNKLVAIARKNLQQSQEREKLLSEQTRVGSKSLADLFRQQAQLSQDESLLLSAENKKRADQILLLQKIRADVAKNYEFVDYQIPEDTPDVRFEDERNLLKIGVSNRADLKAIDKMAKASKYDVSAQWGNYLPKLDLQATLNAGGSYLYSQNVGGTNVVPTYQAPLYSQPGSQTEYIMGIYLSWNIFDRFVTNQNVATAAATAHNAEIDAQDLRNQVRADIRLAFSSYKTSTQQLRSSKKGLIAAQKAFEVIEGRYEVGSANFIDLVTAQAVLLQAESTREQALTDFILQGKAVEFSTGEIKVE